VQTNALYYGDNLGILRDYIADASIDLVYLDPPFNSNRSYSAIFADESGRKSDAQIGAFEDSWHWGPTAEGHYAYLTSSALHTGKVPSAVSSVVAALRFAIHETPMLAYLVEMTMRLVELRRVIKPTGSLYLHCDPTASHYLKLVLDAVFGPEAFRSEFIWKRTNAHSSAKRYAPVHDVILYYARGATPTWNGGYHDHDPSKKQHHARGHDADGGEWFTEDLTGAGTWNGPSGDPWRGFDPKPIGRHWRRLPEELDRLDAEGRIYWPAQAGRWPKLKVDVDPTAELRGSKLQDVWTDIDAINMSAKERLGWDTQKPLALLERLIEASSNPGDIVLDPFCGCGTALVAAQKLERRWIGIDITYLSIAVMRARLRDSFPSLVEIPVIGTPTEVAGARMLAQAYLDGRYQFQWWALDRVGALPNADERKKGADLGIDGRITFMGADGRQESVIVSVKSGKPKADDVRVLKSVVDREKAAIGVLVSLEEPTKPMRLEATVAGTYHSDVSDRDYPKIQLISAADLLERGLRPQLPPLVAAPFQRATRVQPKVDQADLGLR
jgi:site-specific DNA-methyltransferase (adenine-specific)